MILVFVLVPSRAAETAFSFAIYLGQKASVRDARSQTPLSKIGLSTEPFLTDAEILEYRWSKHEIRLSAQGVKKLKRSIENRDEGRIFVVVVDGVRCYRGALWRCIYSVGYPHPVILIDSPATDLITIERAYPTGTFGEGEDPRNDERIYDALKRKSKLKEAD